MGQNNLHATPQKETVPPILPTGSTKQPKNIDGHIRTETSLLFKNYHKIFNWITNTYFGTYSLERKLHVKVCHKYHRSLVH